MRTQGFEYQKVKEKLMPQMQRCRDRGLRVKVELILLALRLKNISMACRRMGVGRTCFHKWWSRLVKGGFKVLAMREQSRRPKVSPGRISKRLERRIRYYRRKGFGAEMIQAYLIREGRGRLSRSTIGHVIRGRQKALRLPKTAKLRKHRKRYELPVPGQRIQIDVKYTPMPVAGETAYVYVAIDECTRWRYAKAFPALNEHWTSEFLKGLERGFPFPIKTIQTDNGHEFTFALLPGKTREHVLDTWCLKRGITHRLIPPGVKELNGKVERSHRIDAEYFYGNAPTHSLKAFNRALENWIRKYNYERPHGGLNHLTPIEKLKERLAALPNICLLGDEEQIRQKFLERVKLYNEAAESSHRAA